MLAVAASLLVAAGYLTLANGPRAEPPSEDYHTGTAIRSAAERAHIQAAIDAERQAATDRNRPEPPNTATEMESPPALGAPEPRDRIGDPLLTTHCGTCHALDRLATVHQTRLGWRLTIARMRHLNRAPIPREAIPRLVDHLAHTQPAPPTRAIAEYGLILTLSLVLAIWGYRRIRSATGR